MGSLFNLQVVFYPLFIITLVIMVVAVDDLYSILGVSKTSSLTDIKRNYKKLARQWHPDKNQDDPSANEKFMKINEAYETLSDETKRANYDNFGKTSADMGRGESGFRHDFQHPFEHFFSNMEGFGFHSRKHSESVINYRITLRNLEMNVIPESYEKPYLIYLYSDFCFECIQLEPLWGRLVQDLEKIGLGIGTVNVQVDRPVASRLRVTSVPSVVGVVSGRYFHHSESSYSLAHLRSFVRSLFPPHLMTHIKDDDCADFLEGWRDNRVRALLFGDRQEPSLRFVAGAFAYRGNIKVGYVNLESISTDQVMSKFNVRKGAETILMFNELVKKPESSITMKQLPRSSIDQLFDTNKFLQLPRLSSDLLFNQLCPISSQFSRKLCVVLICKSSENPADFLATFRSYATRSAPQDERVRYAYIYEDLQSHFVVGLMNRLTADKNESNLPVALMQRLDASHLRFDWLPDGWSVQDGPVLDLGRELLSGLILGFLKGSAELSFMLMQPNMRLSDENAENLFRRILLKLEGWFFQVYDQLMHMNELPLLPYGITFGFLLLMGLAFWLNKSFEPRNHQWQRTSKSSTKQNKPSQAATEAPTLAFKRAMLHPLNPQTFTKLVLKANPGVRTIILFVTEDSSAKLTEEFMQIVSPYSQSNAFLFAFLQLEVHIGWYQLLLESCMATGRSLQSVNVKNCVGTVLAVNGPRKYFCIYHALQKLWWKKFGQAIDGEFLGMETDSEDEGVAWPASEGRKLFHSDLLCNLNVWMERLCEGSHRRIRVQKWPPFYEKMHKEKSI